MSSCTDDQRLHHLVIAEPAESVAEHLAEQTERMAEERTVVSSAADAVEQVSELQPEMMLFSLDLKSGGEAAAKEMRALNPDMFIVGTYRELSVKDIGRLKDGNFDELLPHPVDFVELYRIVSQRFGRAFRRHTRHPVEVEVARPDGVVLGITRDLSEGGLRMAYKHPTSVEQSLLLHVMLPGTEPAQVRGVVIAVDEEGREARIQFERIRGDVTRKFSDYFKTLSTS